MAKVNHEPIVLDINHMMSDVVGFQYGIDADHVDGMAQAAAAAQHNVAQNRGTGWLGWTELPYNQEEIVAEDRNCGRSTVRNEFDAFVVLGIGGSALGPVGCPGRRSIICIITNCPLKSAAAPVCTWRTTSIPSAWPR